MIVNVRAVGFELTESLENFSEEKAYLNFGRFQDSINRVEIQLTDVNGPKGGVAMRCTVLVHQDKQPLLVLQDTQEDLYVAIAVVFQRAKQALARRSGLMTGRRNGRPAALQSVV